MKKLLLLSLVCGATTAIAQIPNSGFETWGPNAESSTTYNVPTSWQTSDVLNTLFNDMFGNPGWSVNTVSQSASPHSGSSAVTIAVGISSNNDTMGGAVYSEPSAMHMVNFLMGNGSMIGFPFTTRPANLTGFYKSSMGGTDSAAFLVLLTKWNTSTGTRDTIVNYQQQLAPAAVWTSFSLPLYYLLPGNPDTAIVMSGIVSQATPNLASTMSIDDIAFSGVAGINEIHVHLSTFVSPNPMRDIATVELSASINNGTLNIYDVTGKKVKEITGLSGNTFTIDRQGLESGVYMYSLVTTDGPVSSGKIIVE